MVFLKCFIIHYHCFPQKNVECMKHSYLTWKATSRYFIALEEAATEAAS